MHGRGTWGIVSGDPARLSAFGRDVEGSIGRVREGAEASSQAIRAFLAAPNDLGTVVADRAPQVGALLRQAEGLGRDLDRFGQLLRQVDAGGTGPVRVSGGVATLLAGAPALLTMPADRVRVWWDSLSATQRTSLVAGAPELIGGLDGIPFADRHRANRTLVRAHLRILAAELVAAERRHADNTDGFWDTKWPFNRDIDDTAAAIARLRDQIAAREDWLRRDDVTIILYDTTGDGRAVVALGDLASATRVATLVPGITNRMDNFHGMVTSAERLQEAMRRADPLQGSVTIAWLGYDTPEGPPDTSAASRTRALEGATALRAFADLLPGETPHAEVTAVGHSYGSVVVGSAAVAGLQVDRVALVGSPGGGADSVAQYQLPASQVYAATTPDDPIRHVYTATSGLDGIALSSWSGFGPPPVDLEHFGNRSPLGTNPAGPTFGATPFSTEGASGHSSYYAPGTDSLANLGRIGVGVPPR
jgi:hypothetical protein